MPQLMYTLEEYVSTKRKKDTIWIVFNKFYNDVHAFKKEFEPEERMTRYLEEDETDKEAQKEFETFMKEQFPDAELVPVFDLVSSTYLQWPYLGSYAIDTDIGSDVYKTLSEKYNDPMEDANSNNAVLWFISYEEAKKFHKKREEVIEAEFGDED